MYLKKINNAIPYLSAIYGIVFIAWLILSAKSAYFSFSDLPEFYTSAKLFSQHRALTIYDIKEFCKLENSFFPLMHNRSLGFFLPPQALLFLYPLALINVKILPAIFGLFLTTCLFVSIAILARMYSIPHHKLAYTIAYLSLCGFAYEPIRIAQLSTILLLGLVCLIYALTRNKDFISGIILNCFWLKPQLIIPYAVFLMGARRYKVFMWAGLTTVLILTILWFLYPGLTIYKAYQALISFSIEHSSYTQPELNATIRGQLLRIFPSFKTGIMQITSVIWLTTLICFFYLGHKLSKCKQFVEMGILLTTPLGILTSLHCYNYDLVFLLPSILIIFKLIDKLSKLEFTIYFLYLIAFFMPIHVMLYYQYLLKGGTINPYFGLLLLYSLLCYKLAFKIEKFSLNINSLNKHVK